PRRASEAVLAASAAGVAMDRAQGQLTTNTAIVIGKARGASAHNQNTAAAPARTSRATMKWRATRSAIRAIRGLLSSASSSALTISARRVCAPTASTDIQNGLAQL